MSYDEERCRECGCGDLVENVAAGNMYCRDCGLECRARMIDYQAECRKFSPTDGDRNDPARVGGPINMLLIGGGLSTSLLKADALVGRLAQELDSERKLSKNFKDIQTLCDRLGLTIQRVKDRACEIFRTSTDSGLQSSSRLEVIQIASVLFSARLEGGTSNRSFKEIVLVTGISQKKIARCFKRLKEILKGIVPSPAFRTEHPVVSFSKNYGKYLNLPLNWVQIIAEVANKTCSDTHSTVETFNRLWDGRSGSSIAATVVYIVTRLPKCPEKVDIKMVIQRSGVCRSAIKACYRDMLPVVARLLEDIPHQIATKEEIRDTFRHEMEELGVSVIQHSRECLD